MNEMQALDELDLLIQEYDPETPDWRFRKSIMMKLIERIRPATLHLSSAQRPQETAADNAALIAAIPEMIESLERLTNASALYGVRQVVAGWKGEGRSEPFQHRHHDDLGAALPKTTCGAVYDLDDALQSARTVLKKVKQP